MNKTPIPSRNKKVTHDDNYLCPYCGVKIVHAELTEEQTEKASENTVGVYCPSCDEYFIPNVTIDIEYKYSRRKRHGSKNRSVKKATT